MDYVHVFVLRTLCLDEDGEIKSRNVAVTFDMFEAEDHRNKGVRTATTRLLCPVTGTRSNERNRTSISRAGQDGQGGSVDVEPD